MAAPTRRVSPLLIGGGVLVIALGFGLPRLLSTTPEPAPEPTLGAKVEGAADPRPARTRGGMGRLAGSLVVVCVLCVLVTRLVNKKAAAATGPMAAVASLRVNARCVVHLVVAGDRRMLVGTDAGGVKVLVELPAEAVPTEVES